MKMEEINAKVMGLSQILCQDIDEVLQSQNLQPVDSTFIVAGAIANLVGVYAGTLSDISDDLVVNFQNMIDKRIIECTKKGVQ